MTKINGVEVVDVGKENVAHLDIIDRFCWGKSGGGGVGCILGVLISCGMTGRCRFA